ncbi:hypothetical protein DPEC_G00352570 [Dallia pectoralis]|uniref:Uncharacterized protein n=1 Tax=Dallia pectoralis TaxID=75939 RepID=A0ACC2F2H3_DALPE|nr:hypothetical protein DPEC_G00352570 [Dallia pectoralis]
MDCDIQMGTVMKQITRGHCPHPRAWRLEAQPPSGAALVSLATSHTRKLLNQALWQLISRRCHHTARDIANE